MTRDGKLGGAMLALLGTASLLTAWQLIISFGLVPEASIPTPWSVAQALPALLTDRDFLNGALDTVTSWAVTVAIGSSAAVVIGLVTSSVPFLRRPTAVVVDTFRSVPATALIPIGVVFFGLGSQMKISIALYAIFWPILINTVYGVASTEPMRLDAARSMRWPWWRRQVFVILPSAIPSILTGIRIATGVSLIVIISTELLGARNGVGTVLVQYTQALRPDVVYAGVLLLGMAGALLFGLLVQGERRLVRWASVG
ncbi:ABC transporter permease [Rhizohabitans arisaemae]|uniref:ABC transporter permease n=1 Tax=Rhizohabitans arisaemae TaxID=2720610 RepID=UPI0024B03AE2|nr:ABC transporter permease [Rhizohabitans arisaemae]